jgi:hypothetical protein
MRQNSDIGKPSSERIIKDIRPATRKQHSAGHKSASCWNSWFVAEARPVNIPQGQDFLALAIWLRPPS